MRPRKTNIVRNRLDSLWQAEKWILLVVSMKVEVAPCSSVVAYHARLCLEHSARDDVNDRITSARGTFFEEELTREWYALNAELKLFKRVCFGVAIVWMCCVDV